MQKNVTIWDIAKRAGVGISTVSRVLNGSAGVNEATQERVRAAIAEYGYAPNNNARQLKQRQADAVAVIVRGTGSMFLASILECLQPRIEALGLRFLAHYIDEHDDEAAAARTIYAEKKVRGLVFLGGSVAGRESALKLPAIPCIYATLDARTVRMENVFSVSIDDRAASFAATEYLLARGHRNIAVLGGKLDAENPIALRYRGVVDAFSARGFAFPAKNYISAGFSLSSAFAAMDAELRNGFRCTAVFAMSDVMAIGAMRALADHGRAVPEDVSLIGFDGIALAHYTIPRLTTMRQNAEAIAQQSVTLLARGLSGAPGPHHVMLQAELIAGASVRPIAVDAFQVGFSHS